jgi:hypothetical protein
MARFHGMPEGICEFKLQCRGPTDWVTYTVLSDWNVTKRCAEQLMTAMPNLRLRILGISLNRVGFIVWSHEPDQKHKPETTHRWQSEGF